MKKTARFSGYEREGIYLIDRMDAAHRAAGDYLEEVDPSSESVASAADWLEALEYGEYDWEDAEIRAQAWETADWLIEYCRH